MLLRVSCPVIFGQVSPLKACWQFVRKDLSTKRQSSPRDWLLLGHLLLDFTEFVLQLDGPLRGLLQPVSWPRVRSCAAAVYASLQIGRFVYRHPERGRTGENLLRPLRGNLWQLPGGKNDSTRRTSYEEEAKVSVRREARQDSQITYLTQKDNRRGKEE